LERANSDRLTIIRVSSVSCLLELVLTLRRSLPALGSAPIGIALATRAEDNIVVVLTLRISFLVADLLLLGLEKER
jgi:hypothetical protein